MIVFNFCCSSLYLYSLLAPTVTGRVILHRSVQITAEQRVATVRLGELRDFYGMCSEKIAYEENFCDAPEW
jgi:hypothetical protein